MKNSPFLSAAILTGTVLLLTGCICCKKEAEKPAGVKVTKPAEKKATKPATVSKKTAPKTTKAATKTTKSKAKKA